jgi:hypothetical protein
MTWGIGVSAIFWALVLPWWNFPFEYLTDTYSLDGALSNYSAPGWALVLWIIIIGTVIPYLLTVTGIRELSASTGSVIGMIEPIFFLKTYLLFAFWMAVNQLRTLTAHRYASKGSAEDFMFQLSEEEYPNLKSHFATSRSGWGGRRKLPYDFTEHGAIMAAPAPADEDLYAILGASIDSTDDELKKAYRALAIKVTFCLPTMRLNIQISQVSLSPFAFSLFFSLYSSKH